MDALARCGRSGGAQFPAPLGSPTWTHLFPCGRSGGAQFPAPLDAALLRSSFGCGPVLVCAVPRAPGFAHLDAPVPVRAVRGCAVPRAPEVLPCCGRPSGAGRSSSSRGSPRPFGGASGCWGCPSSAEPPSSRTRRTQRRGWAGISARRLRCSSVGPLDVLPSVSDRGRRIPTGPAPKNKQDAPQRGAGNCAKDENRPAPEERPEGAASRGAGNCARPPSDGTATKCVHPDRPHKRKRRRPAGNCAPTDGPHRASAPRWNPRGDGGTVERVSGGAPGGTGRAASPAKPT